MNLAFILQSFGIKLSEQEVASVTEAIKSTPATLQTALQRFDAIEQRVNEIHAIVRGMARANPTEAEYERQYVLAFDGEFKHVGQNESGNRNQDAGTAANGTEH